jgi:hypothetical protein
MESARDAMNLIVDRRIDGAFKARCVYVSVRMKVRAVGRRCVREDVALSSARLHEAGARVGRAGD